MSGFLQSKARQERPDVEELKKLANSVDEFTTSLIDPLKSDKPSRDAFGDSLDSIIDKAIEYKQMKVNKLCCDINCSRPRIANVSVQFCYVIKTIQAPCPNCGDSVSFNMFQLPLKRKLVIDVQIIIFKHYLKITRQTPLWEMTISAHNHLNNTFTCLHNG